MFQDDEDTCPGTMKSTEYPSDDCSNSAACMDVPRVLLVTIRRCPLQVCPEFDDVL